MMVTPNIRLVRELGRGGMGSVWEAEHLTLKTKVAVKFLTEKSIRNAEASQRFTREASLAANIKSPHVVQMLDHGSMADGSLFIVMELLDGEPLNTLMERQGRMSLSDVHLLLGQLCEALTKAHMVGIVHRDLKPENLFLVATGYQLFVKVLDFGLSKSTGHKLAGGFSTRSVSVMGTPLYMSPEQLMSVKHVDLRTDLWAVAVTVYYLLTDVHPFNAESVAALSIAICLEEFKPVTTISPDLPAGLDAWFVKALAKEPDERFGSADELWQAFCAAATTTAGPHRGASEPIAPPQNAPVDAVTHALPHSGHTSGSSPQERKSRNALYGMLTVVASALIAVLFYLTSAGEEDERAKPMGSEAPPMGVASTVHVPAASVNSLHTIPTSISSSPATSASVSASSATAAGAPSVEKSTSSSKRPSTRRNIRTPRVDCSNPYYRTTNGDLRIKKGCEG